MSKFEESDLLELFGVFDMDYSDRMIAGSPQRFIRKWNIRIRDAHSIGALAPTTHAESGHRLILHFAEAMSRHRFAAGSGLSLDRIGKLNALGNQAASGKFNLLQDLLIRRRVRVIEALVAASSWLDSRSEALESRRAFEENEARRKKIENLNHTRVKLQTEVTEMQRRIECIDTEIDGLDQEINEFNLKYSQEEIADHEHSREKAAGDRRRESEGIETG